MRSSILMTTRGMSPLPRKPWRRRWKTSAGYYVAMNADGRLNVVANIGVGGSRDLFVDFTA